MSYTRVLFTSTRFKTDTFTSYLTHFIHTRKEHTHPPTYRTHTHTHTHTHRDWSHGRASRRSYPTFSCCFFQILVVSSRSSPKAKKNILLYISTYESPDLWSALSLPRKMRIPKQMQIIHANKRKSYTQIHANHTRKQTPILHKYTQIL